ncbi:MAG: biotin--[acetyl-CoA-carboxylase] ligase [Moraxellaceae bacterium]|nr:biotin--[acetyl-CoA-carboxylase] ligase [Moraxellaceae bacterium]
MSLALLNQLSHDHYVSGQHLAQVFDCTRSAISKQIDQLRRRGVLISAKPSHGYKFDYSYQWWSQKKLQSLIAEPDSYDVKLLDEVDSTNQWLIKHALREIGRGELVVSDFQQAGRGRRGRSWLSLPGRQMTWSQSWFADSAPQAWLGLTLAVGVEVAEALEAYGLNISLKWPNDILLDGVKLAGILVEMEAQHDGPSFVVVGIGINELITDAERASLDQPATDLSSMGEYDRHAVLADIAKRIISLFRAYPALGLAAWRDRWLQRFAWQEQEVKFEMNSEWHYGVVAGLGLEGSLLIKTSSGLISCHSGDVTLRLSK